MTTSPTVQGTVPRPEEQRSRQRPSVPRRTYAPVSLHVTSGAQESQVQDSRRQVDPLAAVLPRVQRPCSARPASSPELRARPPDAPTPFAGAPSLPCP